MAEEARFWLKPISRRKFLALSAAAAGGAAALMTVPLGKKAGADAGAASGDEGVKIVPTSGSHNCGGRCIVKAHVKDGVIVRITTDDAPDTEARPQLRACLRCRSYRKRLYHPDRLKYPMKRVGKRGEGKFERISWDEAITTIAEHTKRIMQEYGPEAIYVHYASGNAGKASENTWLQRLLGLYGGYLNYYGTYSTAQTRMATPYTYGTTNTGNSRE
ncbi:MAG: molybdopterin-dependent oxidoreductase, partial [Moorella humiferrea]|nr:molybdopterin-dependent oxidoreductase [Moorella humiferrea]